MVSVVKTTLGMIAFYTNFVFINRLCLIFEPDQCPAQLDISVPNAMVAFSLLIALGSCQFMHIIFRKHAMPGWVANILDALVTMYLTELCIRQLWIPLLDLAFWMCDQSAQLLVEMTSGGLAARTQPIAMWLQNEAMHSVQMAVAFGFVYTMLYVTGFVDGVKQSYFNRFGRAKGDDTSDVLNATKDSFGLPENCATLPSILVHREPTRNYGYTKLTRKPSLRRVSFEAS